MPLAIERLRALIQGLWKDTVWSKRRQLVQRWMLFCQARNLQLDEQSVLLWIFSIRDLAPQGQLQYVKEMSGTFLRLGRPRQDLLTAQTALHAQGASIPADQAMPIPKDHVKDMMQCLSPSREHRCLTLAIMVAWKTGSRWGEVSLLTRKHFIHVAPNQVIIAWGDLPKGANKNFFTPHMYTVIEGDWTGAIAQLVRELPLLGVARDAPFCPWSTKKFDERIKRDPFPFHLRQYTGHSFKKGASTHITRLASQGADVKPHELSILMKHSIQFDLLSSSDLRYPEAGPDMARWLGTQRLTRLL